ncbi:MAG: hypothetical protein WBM59_17935 [Sedimenticolaceae bacterium]
MLNFSTMNLPPADLSFLQERFGELAAEVREAWEASPHSGEEMDTARLLGQAMSQLIDMLEPETQGDTSEAAEINTLGEYGLHLIEDLSQLALGLEQASLAAEIEQLSLPYALWIARHGGEIKHLAPVVNAVAHFANQTAHPQHMTDLYTQCCELIDATSPACEDSASSQPGHPWRLLLLNRAIVATRSHNPELMEPAFDAIVECLPGEAERFFAEGMEQMSIIDYPDHVREIVRRYFVVHASPRQLH